MKSGGLIHKIIKLSDHEQSSHGAKAWKAYYRFGDECQYSPSWSLWFTLYVCYSISFCLLLVLHDGLLRASLLCMVQRLAKRPWRLAATLLLTIANCKYSGYLLAVSPWRTSGRTSPVVNHVQNLLKSTRQESTSSIAARILHDDSRMERSTSAYLSLISVLYPIQNSGLSANLCCSRTLDVVSQPQPAHRIHAPRFGGLEDMNLGLRDQSENAEL
jgi:hypothetical protein